MSKIHKLAILGIRSFDNVRSETIEFYTPLTLIVGYNGSGKTTIIECLKYATTGELPPNSSRGGAFIHDPKLCGEREVFAQVRLAFVSTTQANMVATRNLQLLVKKSTRSQKTLEGNLTMQKDGERTSVSTRVAELDQMLPQFLGVSKAVLENVVFCHQEESLWPLSEPGSLKKKFDEIFDALRYTKAIENIKMLRKKQNEELGKFKLIEQHSKENKDRADKAIRRSRELSDKIEILRKEHADIGAQAASVGDKAQHAFDNAARYTEIIELLRMAKINRELYRDQVQDLEKDLKILPDSDEWLASELSQFEERVHTQETRREEQRKRYEQVKQEIQQARDKHSAKKTEAGKHEHAKLTHEARIQEREVAIRKAADYHSIRGYDMELDDLQINEFMDRISKLSKDQNARIERLRRENVAEVQKIQDVLDELREQRTTLAENRKSAKERIDADDRKIQAAHAEMQKLSIDEAGRANIGASIAELSGKLAAAKQALKDYESDGKIREASKTLQELEDESASLSRRLIDASKQADERGRLKHLKKEAEDRQRSLETTKGAHGDRIKSLVGSNWTETSLEGDYAKFMTKQKTKLADAQRQRDGVARELEQVEYKLKTSRADLKNKRAEAERSAGEVRSVIQDEPSEYLEVIDDAEKNRDQRKSDVEGFVHMQNYFSKAVEVAQSDKPACRLCLRAFSDAEVARQFASRLMKQSSQKQLEDCRKELEQWEEDLRKYRGVSSNYEAWKRLTEKDIPSVQAEIAKNEELRKDALNRLEEHDVIVRNVEDVSRDTDSLSKPIETIIKSRVELEEFQRQIQQLSQSGGDSQDYSSWEDIQEQMSATETRVKDQRQKVAKMQAEEQGQRVLISTLEMDMSSARAKLVTADHELEKKTAIRAQVQDLKSSIQDQRDLIATLDVEMQELGPRWSETTTKRDDQKQRADTREAELQQEATKLMDTVRELQRANDEAKRYIETGGPLQLAQCQREVQNLDHQLGTLDKEANQITIEANKIQEELSSQSQNKRVISDNLKHREARRKLAASQKEIDRLSAQNAEADQQQHRRDAEHFQKEYQKLQAEAESKATQARLMDDQLKQVIDDWNTEYKDAAPNYKKAHIQVETTKAAVEDLGRYGAALDKAIMRYHTLKMEEINRIVEELWRRTYQGTDVDTILIRSDNETQKGNRSYNYRVCMVKQDAEMDMRGRCSAGQKVLASIIIRLALAECFGVNCGLIALDEPTTNLDRDNIRSLAEALNHIIRQRRQQKNFQLIVITHDEDFLRAIKPQEFCDHYYRVSRNDQQKSIIERQNIAAVM